jgi:hypothetical protein
VRSPKGQNGEKFIPNSDNNQILPANSIDSVLCPAAVQRGNKIDTDYEYLKI